MAIERGSWNKLIVSEQKHCTATQQCSDACKDRGGKAVICLSVLNVSTLIYIIRVNIHYTYAFLSTGCGRLWVVDGQWKLMFAHCMMQRKVNAIISFTLLVWL